MPKAMTAVRPTVTALRLISLSAVATRIWSWLFQGQASGQPAAELTCGEDAGRIPDVEAGELR